MKIYEVRTLFKGQEPLLKNFVKVALYRDRVLAEDRVKEDLKKKKKSQIFVREVNDE